MNGTCFNGGSDEGVLTSGGCQFKSLSGHEVADEQNCWENFRHLIVDEEFKLDSPSTRTATFEASDHVTLMVCVEDTGIGIPLSAQDRIFMPFMQVDSSTSRQYGGTGIGLSISKRLVERMGGQINFVSRPHVGSTFSFTAILDGCKKTSFNDMKKPISEDLPSSFRGLKAILVDRKPVRAAVTSYHLKRLGILVEVVSGIKMEVASCAKNGFLIPGIVGQPDLILFEKDSWLSAEDGGLNIRQLNWKHNGHVFKSPKMILLATNISSVEFEMAKVAGFVDTVIMKPLRASMVAACLQQVGIGKKREHGKDMASESSFLKNLLCGKKILVVDDNIVNRRVAAGALKKFGAHVECVDSGKRALDLLKLPHGFDACFMDIQMPEMDGFEATRRIRQMESEATKLVNDVSTMEGTNRNGDLRTPIIAMTADVINATYDKCLKCGMDGYVSKPFEEENLHQAVAEIFKSKPVEEP